MRWGGNAHGELEAALGDTAHMSHFGGGAVFAGIFLTWFMRPKVYVERVTPRGFVPSRRA